MKIRILFFFVLITTNVMAQELPINPITKLVSLKDSVSLTEISPTGVTDILSNWTNYLSHKANLESVFSINPKNEEILLSFGGRFFQSSQETQRNVFINSASLTYFGKNRDPIFKEVTSLNWINGKVTFNVIYSTTNNKFVYEFTNFEFGGGGSSGRFEEEKPEKPFAVGVLAQNKKKWKAIKTQYFEYFRKLSLQLKDYLIKEIQAQSNHENSITGSAITYASYQKLLVGMTYDNVKKILNSDGKEQSNSTVIVQGKTSIQQVFMWYESELNKSKYIMIIFSDGKILSKSQANL